MRRGRDSEGFMPHCEPGFLESIREMLGKASRGAARGGGGGTAQADGARPPR